MSKSDLPHHPPLLIRFIDHPHVAVEIIYSLVNLFFFLTPSMLSSQPFPLATAIGWNDVIDWLTPYFTTGLLVIYFLRSGICYNQSPDLCCLFCLGALIFIQGQSMHLTGNSISNRFKFDDYVMFVKNVTTATQTTSKSMLVLPKESTIFDTVDFYDSLIGHQYQQLGFMALHSIIIYAGQRFGDPSSKGETTRLISVFAGKNNGKKFASGRASPLSGCARLFGSNSLTPFISSQLCCKPFCGVLSCCRGEHSSFSVA